MFVCASHTHLPPVHRARQHGIDIPEWYEAESTDFLRRITSTENALVVGSKKCTSNCKRNTSRAKKSAAAEEEAPGAEGEAPSTPPNNEAWRAMERDLDDDPPPGELFPVL